MCDLWVTKHVGFFHIFKSLSVDYTKVSRFLNRILGLSVGSQNALFTYFMETMNTIIKEAKRSGRWDEGILGELDTALRYIVSQGCQKI